MNRFEIQFLKTRWFPVSAALLLSVAIVTPAAEDASFDSDPPGGVPAGWTAGVTGDGSPRWAVEADDSAPSPPHVLRQSGKGDFPWIVQPEVRLPDGFVEVKFKAIDGRRDQAGGLVWRWQDGGNYYVARANALEDNVSLYYTQSGRRHTLKYVVAPVSKGEWHTLRVEFSGADIIVILDSEPYIRLRDTHLAQAGAVGLWTKADSDTAFDDFRFGTLSPEDSAELSTAPQDSR